MGCHLNELIKKKSNYFSQLTPVFASLHWLYTEKMFPGDPPLPYLLEALDFIFRSEGSILKSTNQVSDHDNTKEMMIRQYDSGLLLLLVPSN